MCQWGVIWHPPYEQKTTKESIGGRNSKHLLGKRCIILLRNTAGCVIHSSECSINVCASTLIALDVISQCANSNILTEL